ncbi:MAG: DNA ligase [Planctomycetaceae bacterium]
MPEIEDGETAEVKGSAAKPYVLKNTGGVYSCSCPAWRNQSTPIERRTCKHLRRYRGDKAEEDRIGGELPQRAAKSADSKQTPPLLLAHAWDNCQELKDWWISEKLDGVRAYWDGKRFLSRLGNEYMAPEWFIKDLPTAPLDGELWLDRNAFQKTISIVRRQDRSDHWKQVKFLVFDAPAENAVFEERVDYLRDLFQKHGFAYAQALDHQRCRGLHHLQEELRRIEALGGEGLMVREPGSRYEIGRSSTLLKVKTFHDAEATVLAHQPGKGKHKGRMGALSVRLDDGTEFSVGTGFTDRQRETPPDIGSRITFRFQELTDAGVPRFPSFVAIHTETAATSAVKTSAVKRSSMKASSTKTALTTKPAKKAKPTAGVRSAKSTQRYFELVDGKSNKFWEVTVSGSDVTVRYGRIGTDGTSKPKSFDSPAAATDHANQLIDQKTTKGYIECAVPSPS